MFYGGFGTRWKTAKPVAVKSIMLSTLGVVATAFCVGVFCTLVLKLPMLESLLIGSVISCTDAASVFSILKSKNLSLKYRTDALLEVESGSNDPCAYMMTMIVLSIIQGETSSVGSIVLMILCQFVVAIIFGVGIALLSLWILKRFPSISGEFCTLFMFGIILISYALPVALGGNGYLSTYITGIILGNHRIKQKKNLVNFFDSLTSIMQMYIFFLLGLLAYPSKMLPIIPKALIIMLFLTFIARPLVVTLFLKPFKCSFKQIGVISWAGLRGASSIVFSITATVNATNLDNDIFHIVFFIVLISISLQGGLLPLISQKLDMIDEHSDVRKTFTDYQEENDVQFIRIKVHENDSWCNTPLKDLSLPTQMLVVTIERLGKMIVPNGSTVIEPNDVIILTAPSFKDTKNMKMSEIEVSTESDCIDTPVRDLPLPESTLIVMIRRNGKVIVPNGNTVVLLGDVLVLENVEALV
jgi:cell volume regulation protein A